MQTRRSRLNSHAEPQTIVESTEPNSGAQPTAPAASTAPTPSSLPTPKYRCPFSIPRGNKPTCQKPASRKHQTIKNHLVSIRMENGQPIGYNYSHPRNDPLWNSQEVRFFLFEKPKRAAKTAEEKRQTRKARNDRFYEKRMAQYREAQSEWKPKLEAGLITEKEYLEKLKAVRPIGFYKVHTEASLAKTEVSLAKTVQSNYYGEVTRLEQTCDRVVETFWPPQLCDEDGHPLSEPQRDAQGRPIHDADGNVKLLDVLGGRGQQPVTRIISLLPLPNWARPTFEHYCQILALILPVDEWPTDPLNRKSHARVVKMLTSNDTLYKEHNLLGNSLDSFERNSVLQTFNTAHGDAVSAAKNRDEKERQTAQWMKVQDAVKRVFLPVSKPPIVFLKMIESLKYERANALRNNVAQSSDEDENEDGDEDEDENENGNDDTNEENENENWNENGNRNENEDMVE